MKLVFVSVDSAVMSLLVPVGYSPDALQGLFVYTIHPLEKEFARHSSAIDFQPDLLDS